MPFRLHRARTMETSSSRTSVLSWWRRRKVSSTSNDEKPPSVVSSSRGRSKDSNSPPASTKEATRVEIAVDRSSNASSDDALVEQGSLRVLDGDSVKDLSHKKIGWKKAAFILIAETISLGILSLPAAVAKLGLVVGGFMTFIFFVLTLSAGFMLYDLKLRYPQVHGFADAARMIGGPIVAWVVEALNLSLLVFVMACHIVLFGEMAHVIAGNDHWSCSVVFKLIGLIACLVPSLLRTLKAQGALSFASCCSVVIAVSIGIIGIGILNPGKGVHDVLPPIDTKFAIWSQACSNILVSFAGHLAYFKAMEEMEKPEDFQKSLSLSGGVMVTLYMCTGIVVYFYAGPNVEGVALSSASPIVAKIAYGMATPTIIVAGVLAAYLASKRVELTLWTARGMPAVVNEISPRAWICWSTIVASLWSFAFVLANVLPFFGTLLALIGAIAATWIAMGLPAWFCLFVTRQKMRARQENVDHQELDKESAFASFKFPSDAQGKSIALWVFCLFLLLTSCFFAIVGMYGSIADILKQTQSGAGFHPFSCQSSSAPH